MPEIQIKIMSIMDTHQPGFVECLFSDAWGAVHVVHEKIPVVSCENLWADSKFPADGAIRCEIINEWVDNEGRKLITVSTEKPDYIETVDGINQFDLLPYQLVNFANKH